MQNRSGTVSLIVFWYVFCHGSSSFYRLWNYEKDELEIKKQELKNKQQEVKQALEIKK